MINEALQNETLDLLKKLIGFFFGYLHALVDACGVAVADGPDACRT